MRLSVAHDSEAAASRTIATPDPTAPDLRFLTHDVAAALRSFFDTIDRIQADNPVAVDRLQALAGKARLGQLDERGGTGDPVAQAAGAAPGPGRRRGHRLLSQVQALSDAGGDPPARTRLPAAVRSRARRRRRRRPRRARARPGVHRRTLRRRDDEGHVAGPQRRLQHLHPEHRRQRPLRAGQAPAVGGVQPAATPTRSPAVIHEDCVRRVGAAVAAARKNGSSTIDVVQTVARYVPVTLGHRYLGVPVAPQPGSFELTPEMLTYYGTPIDGQPDTALTAQDGVIPDERQMYLWIKAAFQHFFNNVQKDPVVQVQGTRACRQLLAYLLREIGIQRQRLLDGQPVDDTMLTRLLQFQLGRSAPSVARPPDLDPRLVSDLRIAENVMGTIVGAIAGQEEATCRVIDSLIRLQEGEYRTDGPGGLPLRQLCRGHAAGRQRPERHEREGEPGRAVQVFSGSASAAAARRSAAPQVRARRRADCRQPAARGGDPGLRLSRVGDERRARAGRVHPGPAARALPAVRMEPPHLPRAVRVTRHHRRVDGCPAGTAGSGAARAAERATRRSRSSGASATSSSTIRTSTPPRSPCSLRTPAPRDASGP